MTQRAMKAELTEEHPSSHKPCDTVFGLDYELMVVREFATGKGMSYES